jgi:hypothetical protein
VNIAVATTDSVAAAKAAPSASVGMRRRASLETGVDWAAAGAGALGLAGVREAAPMGG